MSSTTNSTVESDIFSAPMPYTTDPITSATQETTASYVLCSKCEKDSDCGKWKKWNMRCSNVGTCVCADYWIDQNYDKFGGCETFKADYKMNHNQCSQTTIAPVPEATKVVKHPVKLGNMPKKCPKGWSASRFRN